MIRKNLLVVTIAILCLTFSIFMIKPTISQSVREYDPWYDINDDGKIDVKDVYGIALKYGTTGTPINKTDLLLQLQSDVASLNSSLLALENTVATQQSEINNLGTELAKKLGTPDYDSGWFAPNQGQSIGLTHNLGTVNVLVYMIGWGSGYSFNQIQYGSDAVATNQYGAYWYGLSDTTITVHRLPNDVNWQEIRVQIWKLP